MLSPFAFIEEELWCRKEGGLEAFQELTSMLKAID
jgi:hypothetical protein